MQPAGFRGVTGFAALGASTLTLLATEPARSAPFASAYLAGAAPIAIAAGALIFGTIIALRLTRWHQDAAAARSRAEAQLALLRAELDEAQAILDGMPELTIRWQDAWTHPRVYGPAQAVFASGHRPTDILDFSTWLDGEDVPRLAEHIGRLRASGDSFELSLLTRTGRPLHVTGRVLGGAAVMRIRPMTGESPAADRAGSQAAIAVLDAMPEPAWLRDATGAIRHGNAAYRRLAEVPAGPGLRSGLPDIFEPQIAAMHIDRVTQSATPVVLEGGFGTGSTHDVVLIPLPSGNAGLLRRRVNIPPAAEALEAIANGELGQIAGVINALSTPIAIFDGRRNLVQANSAYGALWELDPEWLQPGLSEQTILDRLRTQGLLPSEVDYRAWRAEHLKSYTLVRSRETLWHLPDGRSINVAAVPASASGGVIYVFEDMTEQLALESRYNALIQVQSETLNALGEGVAVFGTNGRLTLHNPKLSAIWKLPLSDLGRHPHIDQIGEACARALPEDGALIWRDLKQSIIDLNPTRTDKSGRIKRADGRLIDYATVRLPDGQTLITFADVTESASYQRVLKERNDALITADRLKDAFVQNVSYELRSPLTNIIGFADLLASGSAGELNEKQKSYTGYIRASSATLGILIDNILDLTTVDAGIAELRLERQDIPRLIEQASAGLEATFAGKGGESAINLVIDIAPELPAFVADGTRIVQILYNLLSNAARFSDPGSEVRLTVSARGGDRILFAVEDEGIGISDEVKAALFRRFEGHAAEGRQKGAGLGLAIVRAFVNLHGGTIQIEKREPKGTRVVVNLPTVPAEASSAAE